jgi:hypothetical protein
MNGTTDPPLDPDTDDDVLIPIAPVLDAILKVTGYAQWHFGQRLSALPDPRPDSPRPAFANVPRGDVTVPRLVSKAGAGNTHTGDRRLRA